MTTMHNPPHPGSILREDIIPGLKLTPTEAAVQLGIPKAELFDVLTEGTGITAEFALRIEQWLGVDRGGSADLWIGMQKDYDMWRTRQNPPQNVLRAGEVS